MAITTYSELQSAVADWLNRADLTAVIPNFIALAEAKMNRELRLRDMLTRAEATSQNEYVALPADFLETYTLELNMDNLAAQPALAYIGVNEAKALKANKIQNLPRYYTIVDGAFEILPPPIGDTAYRIIYYAKIPALSNTNTTNWLLLKAPDAYLYSSLLEAAPYLKDDQRIAIWGTAQQKVFDDLKLESERAMRPTTQLTARRRGF